MKDIIIVVEAGRVQKVYVSEELKDSYIDIIDCDTSIPEQQEELKTAEKELRDNSNYYQIY